MAKYRAIEDNLTATKLLDKFFTEEELREIARLLSVKMGRNKKDVINNLLKSPGATYLLQLKVYEKMQGEVHQDLWSEVVKSRGS